MGGKILLLVVAVALAVSGCSYQTAGAPKGDLTLTATFDDAQGLVAGHSVQMSDITIGTVTKVEFREMTKSSLRRNGRTSPIAPLKFCVGSTTQNARERPDVHRGIDGYSHGGTYRVMVGF